MIRAAVEASAFAMELTLCTRCGGLLSRYDFKTDWLGRTVEACPKCGPALLSVRRGAPLFRQPHPKAKASGKCLDCRESLSQVTSRRLRCPSCQKAHQAKQSREYQRQVSAGLRTPARRRFTA